MKVRFATSLLRLVLPTLLCLTVHIEASFGPFGKWKVENANSYIIYNGIYIPNPEQMIDPGSILDSLNPTSGFSNFFRSPSNPFNFFGLGGGGGDDQFSGQPDQYGQYGDQYSADASSYSGSYDTQQPSGSESFSTAVSPEQSSLFPFPSAGVAGLSSLFGFGGGGTDVAADPSAATFPIDDPASASGYSSSPGGFSSYLPWNWFSGNSRSSPQLSAGNQLPDEFSFLLDGPIQVSRRSDVSPADDHAHVPEKEKVSVYLRPIGQGSFLRYELHEPIDPNTELKANPPSGQQVPSPARISSPPVPTGRKKRSIPDKDLKRTPSKYMPRSSFRKPQPPIPAPASTKKKSTVQYNRRRYQQLQKQKKYLKSTPRSKSQKIKKSDDKVADMDALFPCPKVGIWNYNGDVCIAVGPSPTWACKPTDLVASGKLVICRNKILMS